MRELFKFFGKRYSAVNTTTINKCNQYKIPSINIENNYDGNNYDTNTTSITTSASTTTTNNFRRSRSLQKNRNKVFSTNRSFSIVDLFFRKSSGKGLRWPRGVFLLIAAGLLSIVVTICMCIIQPYESIFKWKCILGEGGEIFNLWEHPPVDLLLKIYLYNVTNAEAFMNGTEKMKVEQIGPYVYNEILRHDQVKFNDNGTLSTIPHHPLVWNQKESGGYHEDDLLMLPNIALLSIAQVISEKSYLVRLGMNLIIRQTNSQPIVQMTAKEFLFGYETTLVTLGNQFLPHWISFNKVGLIDRMYDFSGDFATYYTGENNPKLSGLYDTYKGSKYLEFYDDEHCSNINEASDGSKFKSFIETNETLLFFRKSMCRPAPMVVEGEPTYFTNFLTQKYVFEKNAFDNGRFDKRNKCFCRTEKCLPHGLLDVSNCYYGFPIAISYPHFLDADESLLDYVDGSKPNRTEHESYFMINPISGLPLNVAVRFQINMAMRDVSNMAHVEQFSNKIFPMLWLEIGMQTLPDNLKTRFNLYLNILPLIDTFFKWGSLCTGIILLLIGIVRTLIQISKRLPTTTTTTSKKRTVLNEKPFRKMSIVHQQGEKKTTSIDGLLHIITNKRVYSSNDDCLVSVDYPTNDKTSGSKHIKFSDNELLDSEENNINNNHEKVYILDEESAISDMDLISDVGGDDGDDGDDDDDDDGILESISITNR